MSENESLSKELNNYKNKCDKLQIDFNLKNYNLSKELSELKKKNNMINDESKQLNELKIEKEKILEKIKEYKDNEELNLEQIKALKEHIKEMEKNMSNNNINFNNASGDLVNEYNKIKTLYENEVNINKDLLSKIHYKDEQMEGLKLVVNKFAEEREQMISKDKKKSSNNNISNHNKINNYDRDDSSSNDIKLFNNNNNDLMNKLKEAKITINKLKEDIKKLEEENKTLKINNKLLNSEYKSEGGVDITEDENEDEEYNIKKMATEAKKRNQSEDIKIDYPGFSNIKQKYDELEKKYRNLEEAVLNLLHNLKCTSEIKQMIIDICNALEITDDMIKQIVRED
jgi:chromosome segregation ATPase